MNTKKGETSAFPVFHGPNGHGLTKEEWYAGVAISGLVSGKNIYIFTEGDCRRTAEIAKAIAKEMVKE